jgi:hypothetical protein
MGRSEMLWLEQLLEKRFGNDPALPNRRRLAQKWVAAPASQLRP